MLQFHEIKNEDSTSSTYNNTACGESFNSNNHRQILVNFGLNRKIVLTLNGKDKLHDLFTSYVSNEPAFSRLLKDSYVVFQEFSQKFGTWVDVEPKETVRDGAVLKAVFFPIEIERDEINPGSIRPKQKELLEQNCVKRLCLGKIIPFDHSQDEANAGVNIQVKKIKKEVKNKNEYASKEIAGTNKRRKRRSMKIKNETVHQNVNKNVPETKKLTKTQEHSIGELSNKSKDQGAQDKITNVQSLNINKSEPANWRQDSAPICIVSEQEIKFPMLIHPRALEMKFWAAKNANKTWYHTLFSGVALFDLKGNYIKSYTEKNPIEQRILFWGCRSFDGPNIIVASGLSFGKKILSNILESKVIESAKCHYKNAKVTLQFCQDLRTQYFSSLVQDILMRNFIDVSEWPYSTRGICLLAHVWKLVEEKVKSISFSSEQEMTAIISHVWENDMDVQLMCSQFIHFLPGILKSVIQEESNIRLKYVVTEKRFILE